MSGEVCPVCEEGVLTEQREDQDYDGVKVSMIFSTCDTCHSEVTSAEQSRRNQREYIMVKHGGYEW